MIYPDWINNIYSMKKMSLYQLYLLKEKMEKENLTDDSYVSLCEKIKNIEDMLVEDGGGTSATGGPSVGGMGQVVSSQPSGLAGATIGVNWASQGGTTGSGDVAVPYNPSGSNRVFHKVPAMGFGHGPRTGKKSRTKKLDLKALKNIFAKKQDYTSGQGDVKKEPKVMSFDNFIKNDINTVKK